MSLPGAFLAAGRGVATRNEISATAFRIAQAAAWFVSGRLILLRLGQEEYGFMSVMFSIAGWLQMFDLGITSYLRTELPKVRALSGADEAARYYKRAVLGTVATAGLLLLAGNALLQGFPSFDRSLLGLLSSQAVVSPHEFGLVVAGLSAYSLILLCSNLQQAYLAADGRQYVLFLLGICGCVMQPLAIWWVTGAHWSLPSVFALFCIAPVVPTLGYFVYTAAASFPSIGPAPQFKLRNGITTSFFLTQIGAAIGGNLDLILVSHFFGLTDAAVYSIFKLLVQFPISVHAQFNMQSWPMYALFSTSQADFARIRHLIARNSRIAIWASLILVIALAGAGPWFVRLWSKGTLTGPLPTALLFALYGSLFMLSNTFMILMYAFNYTRAILPTMYGVLPCLVLLVWLLRGMGPDSVVLSNAITVALGLAVGVTFYLRKVRAVAPSAAAAEA